MWKDIVRIISYLDWGCTSHAYRKKTWMSDRDPPPYTHAYCWENLELYWISYSCCSRGPGKTTWWDKHAWITHGGVLTGFLWMWSRHPKALAGGRYGSGTAGMSRSRFGNLAPGRGNAPERCGRRNKGEQVIQQFLLKWVEETGWEGAAWIGL